MNHQDKHGASLGDSKMFNSVTKGLESTWGFKIGTFGDWMFIKFRLGRKKKCFNDDMRNFMNDLKEKVEKEKTKSRAADMAKSRANAKGLLVQTRLTEKATASLESLCKEWDMTKTEVINKLLEEQEQRQLL